MTSPDVVIDGRMVGFSGVGTYIENIVPRVAAAEHDWRFSVLAPGESAALWSPSKNIEHRLWDDPIYSLREQISALRKIPIEADLLWVPHYNIPIFYRGRMLVTVHDVFHLAMQQFVHGYVKKTYARLMFAALREKARKIICVSSFTANELMRYAGVDAAKIEVIPNGVDAFWCERFADLSPINQPYLLYVGNVKPHKNLSRLLAAFSSIADDIPHKLVIVGKREGFITGDPEVQEAAQRLGERVSFTGHVDQSLLRRYYSHAALLAFPSLYEGFGLPPLEAMACGCPVVVANAASLPEVCGDAAVYVDPYSVEDIAKTLRRVLRDGNFCDELAARGVEHAARYRWQTAAQQTLEVMKLAVMQSDSQQNGAGIIRT